MRIETRRCAVGLLAVCAMFALAGCGSSSSSASASGSGSKSTAPAAAGIAAAQKVIAPLLAVPSGIGVTEPLKSSPAGKTVDYIECGVPDCKIIGDNIVAAMKQLGVKVNRVAAGNTPESFGRAFDQAVQDRPAGVMIAAIAKSIYQKQLAQFAQLKIPVESWAVADRPGGGLSSVLLGPDVYEQTGRQSADWLTVDSKGKAKILYLNVPIFDFATPLKTGFDEELKKNCPGCTSTVLTIQATDIGKGVPGQVVSYLQQHPDTTYVYGPFGSALIGIPQAIQAAGLSSNVSLFSTAGAQPNFAAIKAGTQKADLSVSLNYLGWVVSDSMARLLTGESAATAVTDVKLPWKQVITKKDVTWDVTTAPTWPFIPGFRQQFEALWKR